MLPFRTWLLFLVVLAAPTQAQIVFGFESCPSGSLISCGPAQPWSPRGGQVLAAPTGALTGPRSGFPTEGARYAFVSAQGSLGSLVPAPGGPAPYPFSPQATGGLSIPVVFPPSGMPSSVSFDWTFVTPELSNSPLFNDFLSVDLVENGMPVLNLLYVDTWTSSLALGAGSPNASALVPLSRSGGLAAEASPLGAPKTTTVVVPPTLQGRALTLEVHVGQCGDALHPSYAYFDRFTLPSGVANAPEYQSNQPGARTSFNTVLGDALNPGVLRAAPGDPVVLRLESALIGMPFEAAITLRPVLARSAGGASTFSGQTVNLDFSGPVFFLNGGNTAALSPFLTDLDIPFAAPGAPFDLSLQMAVFNPAHPDLFSLSQASQLSCTPDAVETYSLPVTSLSTTLFTSAGLRATNLGGQVTLHIDAPRPSGERNISVSVFHLSSPGVTLLNGPTGGLSFCLRAGSGSGTWNPASGAFNLSLVLDVGSWAIDQVSPPTPVVALLGDEDENFRECWTAFFSGIALPTASGALSLSGVLAGSVSGAAVGGVFGAQAAVNHQLPRRPANPPCPAERRLRTQRMRVRPVFVRNAANDPAPTGTSFAVYQAAANAQWAKCCIEFEWLAPTFVNDPAMKTLANQNAVAGRTQRNNLRATVDPRGENDEIEIFFVSSFAMPAHWAGDGVTVSSGQRAAKIIVADAGAATAANVLAHELGHVLGHGHPADEVRYTSTLMAPTGNEPNAPANNPSVVTRFMCGRSGNPLLAERTPAQECCAAFDADP